MPVTERRYFQGIYDPAKGEPPLPEGWGSAKRVTIHAHDPRAKYRIQSVDEAAERIAKQLETLAADALRYGNDFAVADPEGDISSGMYTQDYIVLERGADPPIGRRWTVYRNPFDGPATPIGADGRPLAHKGQDR